MAMNTFVYPQKKRTLWMLILGSRIKPLSPKLYPNKSPRGILENGMHTGNCGIKLLAVLLGTSWATHWGPKELV
jgi:hypothetical protein